MLQLAILEVANLRSMAVSGRQWEGEPVWDAEPTYGPIVL